MDVDFTQPIRGGPTDLGFDYAYFTAACSTIDGPFCYIENDRPTELPDREVFVDPDVDADRRPRPGWIAPGFSLETVDLDFTEKTIEFMEESLTEAPDRPFFVYLALSSPHTPWLPPTFAQGVSGDGDRGDMVVVADWAVGQVVDALDRMGLAQDTLLIVASDNGPRIGTNGHRSAGDLRGYKSHIWEGGHRVPFIARWPRRIEAGAVSDEPVQLNDLMGTVAGIIGVDLPDGAGPDSYDISAAMFGEDHDGPLREAIVSSSENGSYAIRQGPWKLIIGTDGSGGWVEPSDDPYDPERPGQLYNLREDPGEQVNHYAEQPEIVERLSALLRSYEEAGRSRRD
jgi:arylsulfatase A-like enzyme